VDRRGRAQQLTARDHPEQRLREIGREERRIARAIAARRDETRT
jgi:hypothetical protein